MAEIHFVVEEAPEGGFVARAMGADIFIETDTLPELHTQVRDAVHCHFEPERMPSLIRLHITREEVLVTSAFLTTRCHVHTSRRPHPFVGPATLGLLPAPVRADSPGAGV